MLEKINYYNVVGELSSGCKFSSASGLLQDAKRRPCLHGIVNEKKKKTNESKNGEIIWQVQVYHLRHERCTVHPFQVSIDKRKGHGECSVLCHTLRLAIQFKKSFK